MLMRPLPPTDRLSRPLRQRSSRRRALRQMLAGSLLLHVLALLAVFLFRPAPPPEDNASPDEVAMVFESTGAKQASVPSPSATQASASPMGNLNATTVQPNPDTSAPAPPPAPAVPSPPAPAVPPPPAPAVPPPPAVRSSQPPPVPSSQPPVPSPPQASQPPPPQAQIPPPQAQIPPPPSSTPAPPQPTVPPLPDTARLAELPQPAPSQAPPRQQPTVTLSQEDAPALPPLPPFVMPQPPQPLPPYPTPPRIVPPRPAARPTLPYPFARQTPQNPFANPQDFSLNAPPAPRAPGRPSRGFDLSTGELSGEKDATLGYVAGAHPTGDWIGLLRRWATARLYYPEQAIVDHAQGTAVVLLTIARSGRVLNVQLLQSARSPFLDGAWIDVFRGATVPAFTPDMTEDSTQITYTLHYRLVSH